MSVCVCKWFLGQDEVILLLQILFVYKVLLLSLNWVWQLYHVESQHSTGLPVTAVVLRTTIKETHYITSSAIKEYLYKTEIFSYWCSILCF